MILAVYHKWVKYNNTNTNAQIITMYDIIQHELGDKYNMQKLLNDYRYCVDKNRNAFQFDEDEKDRDELFCDIENCFITQRSNRNKSLMTSHNNKRKEMFFASNLNANECVKSIIIQQILDTLHFWVFHTLKFDISQYLNENINEINDDTENIEDFHGLCFDAAIKKLGDVISKKINSSQRYRANEQRYDENNNKFITKTVNESFTNNDEKEEIEQETEESENDTSVIQVINNSLNKLWMDDLFEMVNRYKLNVNLIQQFNQYLKDEEYETEAIYLDIKSKTQSNVQKFIENNDKNVNGNTLRNVLQICLFETDRDRNVYSQGFRYYYWTFYKYNENQWNELYKTNTGRPSLEGNKGYTLKDWYIANKYKNFKEEILNNALARFSYEQYEDTLETATEKRQNWINDQSAPKLECSDAQGWRKRCYGISHGEIIRIEHLMGVLFYCNYSHQSFVFSSTYRRNNIYETNELLKKRHSNFHFWGKYLRECVECFGTTMGDSKIHMFYHGVSQSMLFNSTQIRLNGPVSTTRDFIIAWSVFASEGVVLDIVNTKSATIFFNCNFWSTYTNEDEKLFLSGLDSLTFENIRNIPQQMHFKPIVKLITICQNMFNGWATLKIEPLKVDLSVLNQLIKSEMNACYLDEPYTSKVPKYIAFLFHQFIKRKTQVELNWIHWDVHFSYRNKAFNCDAFGYKRFESIFLLLDKYTFKFSIIIQLCQNLDTITLYKLWNSRQGFVPSIKLDHAFSCEILKCIDMIHKMPQLAFKRLEIVKPNNSIKQFVAKNSKIFSDKGWELIEVQYFHEKKKIKSEALVIQKI